ncbi:MAG TPA: DUF4386 domain-containing protein, partial [Holophagaceae bacterium]|nr:DUF4386 domain-containing protein [Holophagaceae bacterium]
LMVILVVVQVPIAFLDEASHLTVLHVLRGGDYLGAFDAAHREAIAMLLLNVSDHITTVSEVFWGLWLFPLGWLVFRSGMLPRFLGLWLILNGVSYLGLSAVGILWPQHLHLASSISFPIQMGEMALMLWLVVMGAKPRPLVPAGQEA